MANNLSIERAAGDHPDFVQLVKLLDQDLARRDGDEHAFYDQFNSLDEIHHVVIMRDEGHCIAIGAIKEYASDTVEVKRMFTLPEYRGEGCAVRVLDELEKWARELGYQQMILETGKRLPEAIHLYQKSGYERIDNFPPYEGVENSVCFKKRLD